MTDIYTISPFFRGQSREVIEKALQKSGLPEGVSVIPSLESEIQEAKKPFVVATTSSCWEHARLAFRKGAINYVTMDLNPDELALKFDGI